MTVPKETDVNVVRLYYGEHWHVGTIATQLGIHPDVVKRALGHKPTSGDPVEDVMKRCSGKRSGSCWAREQLTTAMDRVERGKRLVEVQLIICQARRQVVDQSAGGRCGLCVGAPKVRRRHVE